MKQEFTNSKQKLRRVIPHNILGFKIVCVYIELYNSGSRNFSRMMKFLPLFVPFPLTKVCLCVLGLKKTNCVFLKINIQQGGWGVGGGGCNHRNSPPLNPPLTSENYRICFARMTDYAGKCIRTFGNRDKGEDKYLACLSKNTRVAEPIIGLEFHFWWLQVHFRICISDIFCSISRNVSISMKEKWHGRSLFVNIFKSF